jgi:hypothetical protein
VFPPCIYSCCLLDHTYHSHKSFPSTLAQLHHLSPRILTAIFFKRLPSPSMSLVLILLSLVVPQTLTYLYYNVWANLSFCLKVMTLCPPTSFPHLSISPCCRYNQIPPHTPFSPALLILLFFLDSMS